MAINSPDNSIRDLLERDRHWAAYALVDLEPGFAEHTEWISNPDSLFMVYRGLFPPVLFAFGSSQHLKPLAEQLKPDKYQFGLLAEQFSALPVLRIEHVDDMFRMVQLKELPDLPEQAGLLRLTPAHMPQIAELFGTHKDRPDAFHPDQLQQGVFYGLKERGKLLSIAGTHVISTASSIAAIGNIFTDPDHRGQGLSTQVTATVCRELLDKGIRTRVLNVRQANHPAVHSYRKLGFVPTCSYLEGIGTIAA